SKWKDEDEDTFDRELGNLSGRFKRAESLSFGKAVDTGGQVGMRIVVTQADGSERQEVIHIEPEEEKELKRMQDDISALIEKNNRLGVAAASRAIWARLKSVEEL